MLKVPNVWHFAGKILVNNWTLQRAGGGAHTRTRERAGRKGIDAATIEDRKRHTGGSLRNYALIIFRHIPHAQGGTHAHTRTRAREPKNGAETVIFNAIMDK